MNETASPFVHESNTNILGGKYVIIRKKTESDGNENG